MKLLKENLKESTNLDTFKNETINVYDIDEFIKDVTDGEWKSHIWRDMAIITDKNGSGVILDYEAIGHRFTSLDEPIWFELSKPEKVTIQPDGSKVTSVSIYPEARIKLTPRSIIKEAPKKEMKAGEFFNKCFGYNQRCEFNLKSALDELTGIGHFDSDSVVESIDDRSVSIKIAGIVADNFDGDCGPMGGKSPYLDDNKVGLYSQAGTSWYTFNDDGSVDVDYSDMDDEDAAEEPIHYNSVLELIDDGDDGWFAYFDEEPKGKENRKKIEEILQNIKDPETVIEEYDRITKSDEKWLDDKIIEHNFTIVSKQDYGHGDKPNCVHYQIISNEGNKTREDLEKEADWIDKLLDDFEGRSGSPCTYNMGLQEDGYISCGFDCRETSEYYKDKVVEDLNKEAITNKIHLKKGDVFTTLSNNEINPKCWLKGNTTYKIIDDNKEQPKVLYYNDSTNGELSKRYNFTLDDLEDAISLPQSIATLNAEIIPHNTDIRDRYVESVWHMRNMNTKRIPTGLYGEDNYRIFEGLAGQLSDGIWENSPRMTKYWKYIEYDKDPDGQVMIVVPTDFSWWLGLQSTADVKRWVAQHLKQVVKIYIEDGNKAEWKRNCLDEVSYIDDGITVKDIYRVYDKLLGRIDRVDKDDVLENILSEQLTSDYNVIKVFKIDDNIKIPEKGDLIYKTRYNNHQGYINNSDRLALYNSKRGTRVTIGNQAFYPVTIYFESTSEATRFINNYITQIKANGASFTESYYDALEIHPARISSQLRDDGLVKLDTSLGTCMVKAYSEVPDHVDHDDSDQFLEDYNPSEDEHMVDLAISWLFEHESLYERFCEYFDYSFNEETGEEINKPNFVAVQEWVGESLSEQVIEDFDKYMKNRAPEYFDKDSVMENKENKDNNLEKKIRDVLEHHENDDWRDGRPYLFEVTDADDRALEIDGDPYWVKRFDDDVVNFSILKTYDRSSEELENGACVATFMISGGKNGSGDWVDYLDKLEDTFRELKEKTGCYPLLYQIDTDIADDVWTGYVFMYSYPDKNESLTESIHTLLTEGCWGMPNTLAEVNKLKDLMQKPVDAFEVGDHVENKNKDLGIGDDELFDRIGKYRQEHPYGTKASNDVRKVIQDFIKEKVLPGFDEYGYGPNSEDAGKKYWEDGVKEVFQEIADMDLKKATKEWEKEKEEDSFIESKEIKKVSEETIEEDIEKHDTLNPKLFNGEELKPEVKETIEKIAKTFIDELGNDGIKFDLKDIVLLGSNVSYNYTKDSDLDIHLIADSKNLHCPDELYPLLYSAYRSMFNHNYNIKINGIPAEIYVEMDKAQARSNGIYSLRDGWLKKPVQTNIPDLDKEAFDKLFKEWEDRYFDLIEEKSKKTLDENSDDYNNNLGINNKELEERLEQLDLNLGDEIDFVQFNKDNTVDITYSYFNEDTGYAWRSAVHTEDFNDRLEDLCYLKTGEELNDKDEVVEALHPEIDLGWTGKGKRHPVDADTFTTKKKGDIISVHVSDDLPDLEYKVYDGSYLDDEAITDSPFSRDTLANYEPTRDSGEKFNSELTKLIKDSVKAEIADTIKPEYSSEPTYVYTGGSWGDVPTSIHIETANKRRIPAMYGDRKDSILEYVETDKHLIAKYLGCNPSEIADDFSNIIVKNEDSYEEAESELNEHNLKQRGYPLGWITKEDWEKFVANDEEKWTFADYWVDWKELVSMANYRNELRLEEPDAIIESKNSNEETLNQFIGRLGRHPTEAEYKEWIYPKMIKFYYDYKSNGYSNEDIKSEMHDAFGYDDLIDKIFKEQHDKDTFIESLDNYISSLRYAEIIKTGKKEVEEAFSDIFDEYDDVNTAWKKACKGDDLKKVLDKILDFLEENNMLYDGDQKETLTDIFGCTDKEANIILYGDELEDKFIESKEIKDEN